MGLFSAISNRQSVRREKYLSAMREKTKCPDCGGRGFIMPAAFEYIYPFDCSGCNGTGTLADWESNQL
ncbi:hypothetical protein BpJC7_20630 [Weizmannia acidilactici]|uniref:Methionine aminopeptidase n=1 Tax=Weizmannia acidilactici TaxID=2607726 RepID=A0A5J4JJM2_9BACI|nr:methionine aminopeptidase [Weizmannia acidilactici]GER67874.1 hypothetical protein BpJC4_23450 [Weizmannia acidilactici]GER70760.1 hypothetical protein BpJC7_20630 [Weizmannia acidilactici]GER73717.1 hypothetical protein BpPP18_17840 [Weizmannia acidilactici]